MGIKRKREISAERKFCCWKHLPQGCWNGLQRWLSATGGYSGWWRDLKCPRFVVGLVHVCALVCQLVSQREVFSKTHEATVKSKWSIFSFLKKHHLEKIIIPKDTCTPAFIAALFVIARAWKQPKCPSVDKWIKKMSYIHTVYQFSSATQSCPTLWDRMDCSTPDLPVHHQLPELAQTHVHQVNDAIQPSYPLLSPSPPAFDLPQHQGLF